MPVMDGYEATRQIMEYQRNFIEERNLSDDDKSKCHVVGVTSFTNEEAVRTCYQAGMSHVLHKPVNVDQIKQALDTYYYPKTKARAGEPPIETNNQGDDNAGSPSEPHLHNFQTFSKTNANHRQMQVKVEEDIPFD
jgi:DNA-binding NarL/FixJ family response regulator